MKSQAIKLNSNWKFREWGTDGEYMPATVPGDVTRDMCNVLGENKLYVDFNYKKYKDFAHNDYEYVCTFDVPEDVFDAPHIYLEFLGVDTYSDIMINGISVGSTTNMFMGYRFDVKRYVKRHGNELTVHLKSIFRFMEENKEYMCIFERDRMYIRKASYQFGWDWAPNFPAYGIWQDVLLYGEGLVAIKNVRVRQNINGDAAFLVELTQKSKNEDLTLEIDGQKITVKTIGKKNIINAKIQNPKLWWPNGMGDQPLYDYKLTLNHFEKPTDVYEGYMAFRKVEMDEGVIDANHLNFQLKINNLPVFLSGSNWVPQSCLTGTVTDETYIRHVKQAKDANFNIFRVWGGGVYEKDIFYRLCDESGIMILQETMFACSDVPADYGDMMKRVMMPELEYQLKRLANHPCIVIWTGGNELFSPFGENPNSHVTFSEYGNRGLVNSLTDFYFYLASPNGYTDIMNMPQSGDAHMDSNGEYHNCKDLTTLRAEYNKLDRPALTTEAAIPCAMSYENMMRCTENEQVWPIGPYLEERYGCNPYGGYIPFINVEMDEVRTMFGEPKDVRDFIKKSFVVYAERLAMEIQTCRSRGLAGFLNWMFEDTWPDGSWALVDYYGDPKSGLYAFARNFEPVGPTVYERREDGKIGVWVRNGTNKPAKISIEYGIRNINGEYVEQAEKEMELAPATQVALHAFKKPENLDEYVYARVHYNGKTVSQTYFLDFAAGRTFKSDYSYQLAKVAEGEYKLVLNSKEYTRFLRIRKLTDAFMTMSDNFFDMEKGEKKVVTIYSDAELSLKDFEFKDFNEEW